MTAFTTSPAGLALIQDFEGFHAEPVRLPTGAWLVGHGHVRPEAGEAVNETEAAILLASDLAALEELVNAKVVSSLTQEQFDALVSFAFSIGAEAFEQSQVLRRVNAGEFVAAACAMDAWRKSDATGELEVMQALVRRRAAEKAMFLRGVAGEAAPSALLRPKLDYAASILGAPIKYAASPEAIAAPVAQNKLEAARLVEVLKAEPATEVLLLTQVVADDASDEIATAHARPVARKLDVEDLLPVDRRIRNWKSEHGEPRPRRWLTRGVLENVGLVVLLFFGVVLLGTGCSMLIDGDDDASVLGALALCGPGAVAAVLAIYGFVRAPSARAHAH